MSKLINVSLPEEGADKFVTIRNAQFMRWREQRQLQQQENEDSLAYSARLIKYLVVGGNITAEDGRTLQYPLSDDDLDEFTTYTINQIMLAFRDAMEAIQPEKKS